MAKKEKATTSKVANKTPELAEAKKALETYLKENNLDPTKDWTSDKKHGKKVKALVAKLNKERDKAAAKYPESDPKTMKQLKKKAAKTAITLEKKKKKDAYQAAEAEAAEKAKAEKKAKKASAPRATKYDYPLVDGREMTSAEKKKYRMEQRKLAGGKAEKPAKAKEEKAPKAEKAKKVAKVEKAEKPAKEKKVKKIKKVAKDED